MKKLLINFITFLIIFFIVGEVLVRLRNSVSDIPQRQIDENGIQKYIPNQQGFWRGGTHTWSVNELGWPGVLPKEFDNLITIIGDSFIENFMNPADCHQSIYLKKKLAQFNFLEAGRSGVSFIESMEVSKQFIKYNPKTNLIYVKDNDFYQSLVEIKTSEDITQYSIESNTIVQGKMKSPGLKKILYNWKFAYFLYNKKYIVENLFKKNKVVIKDQKTKDISQKNKLVFLLLDNVKANYKVNKITLVFHPDSSREIINKCKDVGFNIISLNSEKDDNWSFENDSHWTCYGHEQAALQIVEALLKKDFN